MRKQCQKSAKPPSHRAQGRNIPYEEPLTPILTIFKIIHAMPELGLAKLQIAYVPFILKGRQEIKSTITPVTPDCLPATRAQYQAPNIALSSRPFPKHIAKDRDTHDIFVNARGFVSCAGHFVPGRVGVGTWPS